MAIETLRDIFSNIANALRRKGIDKVSIHPEEYADLIDSITTGEGGVDTSDGTATPDDLASGKIAYSKDGRIVGSVTEVLSGASYSAGNASQIIGSGNSIVFSKKLTETRLIRSGAECMIGGSLGSFGTASVSDVVKGKTFTSKEGYMQTGTYEPPEAGIDTSDATATPNDIALGASAYVDGEKIEGALNQVLNSYDVTPSLSSSDTHLITSYSVPSDVILRKNASIKETIHLSNFGTATALDVAAGKTFTSTYGFKITGTGSKDTLYGVATTQNMGESGNVVSFNVPFNRNITNATKIFIFPTSYNDLSFSSQYDVLGRIVFACIYKTGDTVTGGYHVAVDSNGNFINVSPSRLEITDYPNYTYITISYPYDYRFLNGITYSLIAA